MQAAGFKTVGIDVDAACVRDYMSLTGHSAYQLDLMTAQPQDLRDLVGDVAPEVVLTSPPCKAFSGCLPIKTSQTDKYLELSSLAERGLWLVLEAWPEAPPRLIALENVPRIQSRGRQWLDEVAQVLHHYGYRWEETTHDCAELGGLAQRRRRFLGVARHMESTPEWLYEPPHCKPLGVGEVIGGLPVPLDGAGGPMHRLPRLSARNWLRLALIPPGGDWRDIPEKVLMVDRVVNVQSSCSRREGSMGVTPWSGQVHAVIGAASVQNTGLQVADPRLHYNNRPGAWGVTPWQDAQGTIIAWSSPYHGQNVVDPRLSCAPRSGAYGVSDWHSTSCTVVGSACHDNSAVSVNDPRWPEPTHKIRHMFVNGERIPVLVGPPVELDKQQLMIIEAADGTWHRPLTTLELAALQSLPVRDGQGWLTYDGRSHKGWRMRIGNAIPPRAAQAIGEQMMMTLNASDDGRLLMSASNIWVDEVREGVCDG
jgi:site-specific DNA-cytosine methylase